MSLANPSVRSDFRPDINGLRAWAVLAVLLFHFKVPGFGGGFVGVDVFFVISGYLMTKIIVVGLIERRFSLASFYLARARRIVPALLVVCGAVLAIGWVALPPMDLARLGSHVMSAAVFISNIRFSREAGYFDAAAHEKLLLHTWSLSVEWQFYLLLPLLLMLVFQLGRGAKFVPAVLVTGFVVSLAASILLTASQPSAAFYSLPTRAWEMFAGGLVYLFASRLALAATMRRLVEATGFVLILGSIYLFDPATPWPSWRALMPVLGAALVIVAARPNSPLTGSRPAQWLGDVSYSLYLWHWPVVVVWGYLGWIDDSIAIIAGLALSLVLGGLSYRWIEVPSKRWFGAARGRAAGSWIALAALSVIGAGYGVRAAEGVPGRLPDRVAAIFDEAQNKNPRAKECVGERDKPVPGCTYGGDKLGVIVFGDSHAAAVVRAVEKALPSSDLHVLDWTVGGCPTVLGVASRDVANDRCGEFVAWAVQRQAALPPDVPMLILNRSAEYVHGPNEPDRGKDKDVPRWFVGAAQPSYNEQHVRSMLAGMVETACAIAKTRPVYLVRPVPELKRHVPNAMARALLQRRETEVSIPIDEYRERNAAVWQAQDEAIAQCGVRLLDPSEILCREGRCSGERDGLPIYFDDDHLNERGGEFLVPLFRRMFPVQ
ncbi:MAG: acyltransferase family protein [Burkholderiaceae bacterium]